MYLEITQNLCIVQVLKTYPANTHDVPTSAVVSRPDKNSTDITATRSVSTCRVPVTGPSVQRFSENHEAPNTSNVSQCTMNSVYSNVGQNVAQYPASQSLFVNEVGKQNFHSSNNIFNTTSSVNTYANPTQPTLTTNVGESMNQRQTTLGYHPNNQSNSEMYYNSDLHSPNQVLSQTLIESVQRSKLPPLLPILFDGNAMKFVEFNRTFDMFITKDLLLVKNYTFSDSTLQGSQMKLLVAISMVPMSRLIWTHGKFCGKGLAAHFK